MGFGDIIERKREGNELDLEIELLNPDDRLSIEVVSIDNTSEQINIYMKNANVKSRIYSRKSAEKELLGALGNREMMLLACISAVPFFGGFARSFMTLALAKRIDRISSKGG